MAQPLRLEYARAHYHVTARGWPATSTCSWKHPRPICPAPCGSSMAFLQGFNRRHERVGHVLQDCFKAIVVERDSYLLRNALRPVRYSAGYCPCGSAPAVSNEMRSFGGPILIMGTACLKSAARRGCTIRPSVVL